MKLISVGERNEVKVSRGWMMEYKKKIFEGSGRNNSVKNVKRMDYRKKKNI